jgi:hypothetical protein
LPAVRVYRRKGFREDHGHFEALRAGLRQGGP